MALRGGALAEYGTTTANGCIDKTPSAPDCSGSPDGFILSPSANWLMAAKYTMPAATTGVVEVLANPGVVYDAGNVSANDILLELTVRNAAAGTPGTPDQFDLVIGSITVPLNLSGTSWSRVDKNYILQGSFDAHTSQGLVSAGNTVNVYIRAVATTGSFYGNSAYLPSPISLMFNEATNNVTVDP